MGIAASALILAGCGRSTGGDPGETEQENIQTETDTPEQQAVHEEGGSSEDGTDLETDSNSEQEERRQRCTILLPSRRRRW